METASKRQAWNEDSIATAAATCQTRGEFRRNYPSAYTLATRYGWLDEMCRHMSKVYQTWTDEALSAEAMKYDCKARFREGSPNAYAAAIRQKKLDQLAKHFVPAATPYRRHLVYRLDFANCSYIGLTCTRYVRARYHLRRGAVARHIKATGEELPEMVVLAENLTPQEASAREIAEINNAKEQGVQLLNGRGGGQLGAFGRSSWTKERCLDEAKKFGGRTSFKKGSPAAFSHAREEGWLDEITDHMVVQRRVLKDADVARVARRFTTRAALQKYEPSVYNAARERKILELVCSHMRSPGQHQ